MRGDLSEFADAPLAEPEVLHASPELTVQRIAWPGGTPFASTSLGE